MASNYYDYITETGVIVPDTETVLSELQSMMRELFGQDMDLTAETPQGRLLEMWTRNREFCIQICAMVSNACSSCKDLELIDYNGHYVWGRWDDYTSGD